MNNNSKSMNSKLMSVLANYGGWIAFGIVFLIQISLAMQIKTLHYVPDELGTLTAAAQLSGYDWKDLWSGVGAYYGIVSGLLFTPLFIIIKDSLLLYKWILIIIAFVSSFSAYYAFSILKKHLNRSQIWLCLIGAIGCSFMTGWRSSNAMNEFILTFIVWTLVYLVDKMYDNSSHRIHYTIYILILLWLALVSHTRGIVIVAAFVFTVLIYYLFNHKSFIPLSIFFIGLISIFIFYTFTVKYVQEYVYGYSTDKDVLNSLSTVGEQLLVNNTDVKKFSFEGLRGFLDIVTGNVFAITIASGGIVILGCWKLVCDVLEKLKLLVLKKIVTNEAEFYIGLFATSGLVASLIGHGLLNMTSAVIARQMDTTMSMYLYPRYFCIFWGPIFLFLLIKILKYGINIKVYGILTIITIVLTTLFAFRSFIYYQASYGGDILDAWRVLYPLNFQTNWQVPMYFKNYVWGICLTIVLFIVICRLISNNRVYAFSLLSLILLLYQYSFISIVFDKAYTDFVYDQVSATYELFEDNKILDEIKQIYFIDDYNKRAPYALQFLLKDKKIAICDELEKKQDNAVIFVSYLTTDDYVRYASDFKYLRLDNDEFLIIKGNNYQKLFEKSGFVLNSFEMQYSASQLERSESMVFNNDNLILQSKEFVSIPDTTLAKGSYEVEIIGKNLENVDINCYSKDTGDKILIEDKGLEFTEKKYNIKIVNEYDCIDIEIHNRSISDKSIISDVIVKNRR